MKDKRAYASFIIFLSFLSLLGVGFASWSVAGNTTSKDLSGMIEVEDVLKYNEYINFVDESGNPTNQFDIFKFYKTGFVNNSLEIVDTGYINIYLKIDLDKCFEKFSTCNSISYYVDLECTTNTKCTTNTNIFNNIEKLGKEVKTYVDGVESSYAENINNEGTKSTVCVTLEHSSNSAIVQVSYKFTIKDLEYFKTTLYNAFNQSDFNFSLSARFTGNES